MRDGKMKLTILPVVAPVNVSTTSTLGTRRAMVSVPVIIATVMRLKIRAGMGSALEVCWRIQHNA